MAFDQKKYNKQYYKEKNKDPEFIKKRKKYMKKYYERPEVKKRKKKADKKYRSKPEVKKRKNEWQKKYWRNNPEKRKKLSREYNQKKQKVFKFFQSLKKYICLCGNILYGKPGLNIFCVICKKNYKEVENETTNI